MPGFDVVVIGGGITGCSSAYHLAHAGVRVLLLERGEIAMAASGASAGGVRQQNRLAPELPLAMRAIARWPGLADELGADIEYRRVGHLHLIEREEQLPALEASVARQRADGLDLRIVSGAELREILPAAAPQILAGSYCPTDGYANPILATYAFARAAQRHGATLRTRTAVSRILVEAGRIVGVEADGGRIVCRHVVAAAGAWTPGLAAAIGLTLPIESRAPSMMVTERVPGFFRPVVTCMGRKLSLKQMPQGTVLIGGGWPGKANLESGKGSVRPPSVQGSAREATAVLPRLRRAQVVRAWSGVEAECADTMPILGQVPHLPGLLLAAGFSGHGFALAPAIGEAMAALVVHGKPPLPLDALSLGRFATQPAASRTIGSDEPPNIRTSEHPNASP